MPDDTVDPLTALRQRNAERIQRLQQQGLDLSLIPFIDAKIMTLIDLLLHGPFRHVYELSYEGQVANLLDEAEAQANKAKIVVPTINPKP